MKSSRIGAAAFSIMFGAMHVASMGAQTSKGSLVGVAKDATGATVPNANVVLKGEQTGELRTLTTGSDGSFRADALSPESYTITATREGFSSFTAQHVVVAASVVTTYNVALSVGSRADTVSVEANPITINADNGQLAQTISAREIDDLPVFSQSPYELASTIPGVQPATTGAFSNGQNFQVDGNRPRSNNFLLDSQEINDIGIGGQAFQPDIQDLYENLTVITSSASAEYGRAGGGVFNLVTKSGTNKYHGTAYDRYTGSGINAVPNYLRGTGTRNSRFDTHGIGGTAGGYIFKDKLFAFGGTQFTRTYGNEQIAPFYLPDAVGVATLNSLTGVAAQQVALLKQYTTNNFYLTQYKLVSSQPTTTINVGVQPGCATNPCIIEEAQYQRPSDPQVAPDTQWSYRIDFKPHEKDTFYFRYLHDRSSLTPDFFANAAGGQLGLPTYQGGPSELGAGSWTHVFTGNVVNEFRASETRINFLFGVLPSTLANPAYALPTVNIAGLPALGPGQNFPQGRAEDLYQIQDTFSYTHGRQSIRAGFDIGHQLEKDTLPLNAKGTITFAKGSTGITALGNFLNNQTGPAGTITRTNGSLRADPHVWRSGFFAQDDIKLNPQLTVNLGFRYDYTGDPANSLPFPGLDLNNPFGPIATRVAVKNDKNNASPRIGFAYSPNYGGFFGSGKTVVRGGFGIFYDNYFSNIVTNAATSAPNAIAGTQVVTTGVGIAAPFTALANFTPTTVSQTASVTGIASNLVNPETYQYNLGVEQSVLGAVVSVRYVGNHGSKLFASRQLNYFNGAGARLNPTRGVVNVRGNFADSNYNAMQAEFSKRFRSNFTVRANYTYSKDLDNNSEVFAASDSQSTYSANLAGNGLRQDYGNSAYDHRHYVSLAYVWAPRGFRASNKFADTFVSALTRNFVISGVEQFQSGAYETPYIYNLDTNGDGYAFNDRPSLANPGAPFETAGIDGTFVGGTPGVFYDIAQVNTTGNLVPVTAQQVHFLVRSGNNLSTAVARNSYLNPGSTRNDVAIQKGFGTGLLHLESGQFLIRVEAQNVGNHNDRGPYLDTGILDFGTPTSLNTQSLARGGSSGRALVLWGKFVF